MNKRDGGRGEGSSVPKRPVHQILAQAFLQTAGPDRGKAAFQNENRAPAWVTLRLRVMSDSVFQP